MMTRRTLSTYGILAILFFVFAVLQVNDPDPLLWICIYCALGIVSLSFVLFRKLSKVFASMTLLVILLLWLSYFPELIKWIDADFPSLLGEMKAENPIVENMREFGGLTIGLIASIFFFYKSFKD